MGHFDECESHYMQFLLSGKADDKEIGKVGKVARVGKVAKVGKDT